MGRVDERLVPTQLAGDDMEGECQHDWRRGPSHDFGGALQIVCCRCWKVSSVEYMQGLWIEPWTEEDYWKHLDAIEGDRAPEIRKARG